MAYSTLRQAGFVVDFVPWDIFSHMLVGHTKASTARALRDQGFDCVFGGIDLCIRYVLARAYTLPTPACPPPRPPSRVRIANEDRNAFLALQDVFPVFQSPKGCAAHGAKAAFNKVPERISEGMGMRRPRTERLIDLDNPPLDLVLKREFSDAANDDLLPDQSKPAVKQEERAKNFLRGRAKADPDAECYWLAQEYVPFLRIEEIRFLCVQGVPVRDVVNGLQGSIRSSRFNDMWSYESNDPLKTLADLRCVRPNSPHQTGPNSRHPTQGAR